MVRDFIKYMKKFPHFTFFLLGRSDYCCVNHLQTLTAIIVFSDARKQIFMLNIYCVVRNTRGSRVQDIVSRFFLKIPRETNCLIRFILR